MKIRILGNSIRFRLSQGDLKTLEAFGTVGEAVHFPNGQILLYTLGTGEESTIEIDFQDQEIKALMPAEMLSEWITTNRVGYDQILSLENGTDFKILIEKDFKCLTDRAEDERDLFPHPKEEDLNC